MTGTHQENNVTRQQDMFSSVDVEQLITLTKQLDEAKQSHFLHLRRRCWIATSTKAVKPW